MESYVLDCLLCLLPCSLFFLLCLGLRWPGFCSWVNVAAGAAGWKLWVTTCLILDLPLLHGDEELKPPETSSGQTSDGPRLICKPSALARYLLQHCGSLTKAKLADWPWGDPHLQTVSSQVCGEHADSIQFTREHLLLKDGGVVALDWANRRWEVKKEQQSGTKALGCFTSTPPVLLLVPQTWGGTTPHLQRLSQQAARQGFSVVVFHHRGTAGSPLTTARICEFGDSADLEQAVLYVRSRHPSSVLVAVSEGSGSAVLLSYLGERGSSTCLTAAAAISPVLLGQRWFESAMPPLYRWGVLFHRKMQLSRYVSSLRGILDVDRALRSSSLRDFEETLFCSPTEKASPSTERNPASPSLRGLTSAAAWALGERAYPAANWESYWGRNEPLRDADEVAVPVLCICSSDDPLLPPASTLPVSLFQSNPYFLLALTDRGGHCGFTLDAGQQTDEDIWSHIAVLEFLRVASDFLKEAERDWKSWRGQQEVNGVRGQKSKMNAAAMSRRRRGATMKRSRPQPAGQSGVDDVDGDPFTWKRSYTR